MAVELVELGLAKPSSQEILAPERLEGLTGFLVALIELLAEIAIDDETLRTPAYRSTLSLHADELQGGPKPERLTAMQSQCLSASREYFAKSRQYWTDKETEFRQMISLLMSAVSSMTEGNETYHSRILASSDQIWQLAKLDDIRQLKAQLASGVEHLKMTVEEKRQQDQRSLTILSTKVATLQEKLNDAVQKAALDGLTGLANRETFDHQIERLVGERDPRRPRFLLALLDLDDFKKVNDTHGHPIGDRVLVAASQQLVEGIRKNDLVARYGGEEFAIIMHEIELAEGEERIQQIMHAVASTSFEYKKASKTQEVQFTMSAGLTAFVPGDSAEELIGRADAALYAAKHQGKNRLVVKKKSRLRSLLH